MAVSREAVYMQTLQSLALAAVCKSRELPRVIAMLGMPIVWTSDRERVRAWAAMLIQRRFREWSERLHEKRTAAVRVIERAYLESLTRGHWMYIRSDNTISCYSWDVCYRIFSEERIVPLSQMGTWTSQHLFVHLDAYADRPLLAYSSKLELWITRYSREDLRIAASVYGGQTVGYAPFWMEMATRDRPPRLYHSMGDRGDMATLFSEAGRDVGGSALMLARIRVILAFLT
jgi:hypothetical protein